MVYSVLEKRELLKEKLPRSAESFHENSALCLSAFYVRKLSQAEENHLRRLEVVLLQKHTGLEILPQSAVQRLEVTICIIGISRSQYQDKREKNLKKQWLRNSQIVKKYKTKDPKSLINSKDRKNDKNYIKAHLTKSTQRMIKKQSLFLPEVGKTHYIQKGQERQQIFYL